MWFRQILDFRVKDIKFSIFVKIFIKFVQFWSKIEFCGLGFKGFQILIFTRVKDFKFHKFAKIQILQKSPNFVKTILNITNFVGSRWRIMILWRYAGLYMDNKMYLTTNLSDWLDISSDAIPLPLDEWVWKNDASVLRIFLQNFGDESQFWIFWWFWYRLQKFEKNLVRIVTPYWDQFGKFWPSNFGEIAKLW